MTDMTPELVQALNNIHAELQQMNKTLSALAASKSRPATSEYTPSRPPMGRPPMGRPSTGRGPGRPSSARPTGKPHRSESSDKAFGDKEEGGFRFPPKKSPGRPKAGLPPKKGGGYPKKPR